ncbi:MAG: slipin family protein [Planctomycetota bacterium]
MNPLVLALILVFGSLFVSLFNAAVWILREYERGVVYTLGRFSGIKGPGFFLLIPVVQRLVKTDLRTFVRDVPAQDVISRDNVSVKVNAVLYYRIVDPDRAINQVEDFAEATSQLAQTTLRSVLGKHDLDEMLAERDKLNDDIQEILDRHTDAWGIKVANVEIKHVDLDERMVRAIAKQAEAERYRRAKVINAEGEEQAATKLTQAAATLSRERQAMQLRYLAALHDIAGERSSTIVFPLPIDLLAPFANGGGEGNGGGPRPETALRRERART